MKLADYIKVGIEEGKEKHIPFIKVDECSTCGELSVVVKVGEEVLHPSTHEHYIQYINLYGITSEDKLVLLTKFDLGQENTVPYVKTHIKKDVFKELIAIVHCNLHGLWEGSCIL